MCGFHQGQRHILSHPKAGYMDAIFFLSRSNFFLASRGEPYMTLYLYLYDPVFSMYSKDDYKIYDEDKREDPHHLG